MIAIFKLLTAIIYEIKIQQYYTCMIAIFKLLTAIIYEIKIQQ